MTVSASKSALLLSPCLRWAWEGAKEYEDEFADTTKRDKGTLFHAAMDRYYRDGDKWLKVCVHSPQVTSWAAQATAWSRQHLEPRMEWLKSEVYIGYNFDGEYHMDSGVKDRKYPDMPGYVPGTSDLVGITKENALYIGDWKTGKGTGAREQLMTLACGFRHAYRLSDGEERQIILAALYISDTGEVHPHEWTPTRDELDAHDTAMRFQLMDVGSRREPVAGIHCTQLYCPHLAYCPGIRATVEAAAESPEGLLPEKSLVRKYNISSAPSSPAHAGSIMERVTAAKRQLAFYEARIKKYCEDGGKCIAGAFEYSKKKDGFRWREKK